MEIKTIEQLVKEDTKRLEDALVEIAKELYDRRQASTEDYLIAQQDEETGGYYKVKIEYDPLF